VSIFKSGAYKNEMRLKFLSTYKTRSSDDIIFEISTSRGNKRWKNAQSFEAETSLLIFNKTAKV
jgi:hypothetical protein